MLDGLRLSYKLFIYCLSSGVSTYDIVECDDAVVVDEELIRERVLDGGGLETEVVVSLEALLLLLSKSDSMAVQLGRLFNYKK